MLPWLQWVLWAWAEVQPAYLHLLIRSVCNMSGVLSIPPLNNPCQHHSLCNTTINPIIPSMTCFSHGCSLSSIVT